ncbi:MAG: hypothetical protein AAGF97_06875 [Planctomycetota bacterium]
MADDHADHNSAWMASFSPEQREEQVRGDQEAWYGIIGLLIGIAALGVFLGICTVLGITFLT